jgi:single-stranded-DNA-specific exonuclease
VVDEEAGRQLGGFTPAQRQVLVSRGLRTEAQAVEFLDAVSPTPDPFALAGMAQAVERILAARQAGEIVAIYGDYDADGVTAASVMSHALARLGMSPVVHIPLRFDEGYGLNPQGLEKVAGLGARLIVTVDCGIRSLAEVRLAQDLGMDMVLTDHHDPGEEIPAAQAVIDPKAGDGLDGFREFSGAGVAYLLAAALASRTGAAEPEDLLDLVAIGTVSDLVPLVGPNRSLVRRGLERLRATPRPGLQALIEVAGLRRGRLVASSIGFGLGPRLNAAGRLKSAETAFQLVMAESADEAKRLAGELDATNRMRQDLTRETVEAARRQVLENGADAMILYAGDGNFNEGVVGLAAGRLMEEFNRPCVVASIAGEAVRASVRSIPGFHITRALDECAEWLTRYGGHAAAAGFSVAAEDLPRVLARLEEVARREFGVAPPAARIALDAEVELGEVDEDLMTFIERLEPCGFGNAAPLLGARGVRVVSARQVGADGAHLKMMVQDRSGTQEAIAFRMGHRLPGIGETIDVAFQLERNEYMGVRSLQMNVREMRGA